MARRYGGCKPLAPVGPNGEAVIDLAGQRRGGRRLRRRSSWSSTPRPGRPSATTWSGAGPPRSTWLSPSSASRSARSTPCWPPGRPSAPGTVRRGQRRRRLRRRGHGPVEPPARHRPRRARAGRLPAAPHGGDRRPGDPGDLRGGRQRAPGRPDRAAAGHPATGAPTSRAWTACSRRSWTASSRRRSICGASSPPSGTSSSRPWPPPASTRRPAGPSGAGASRYPRPRFCCPRWWRPWRPGSGCRCG